jgi:hypothetical protein
MNRPTLTLAALTGAAALTVAGMSPASAASWAHEDAVGDVRSYTWDERKGTESGPDPRPANTDTDIARFSARHTPRRVVLTTTLRDITPASGVTVYQIRTGNRAYEAVQRLGTKREMGPAFRLYRLNGDPVRCKGVRRSVDRTTEQAVVSIPRRCLGRPRWVRVGAGAVNVSETRTTFRLFFDDALRAGAGDLDNLRLSPRIRHG